MGYNDFKNNFWTCFWGYTKLFKKKVEWMNKQINNLINKLIISNPKCYTMIYLNLLVLPLTAFWLIYRYVTTNHCFNDYSHCPWHHLGCSAWYSHFYQKMASVLTEEALLSYIQTAGSNAHMWLRSVLSFFIYFIIVWTTNHMESAFFKFWLQCDFSLNAHIRMCATFASL